MQHSGDGDGEHTVLACEISEEGELHSIERNSFGDEAPITPRTSAVCRVLFSRLFICTHTHRLRFFSIGKPSEIADFDASGAAFDMQHEKSNKDVNEMGRSSGAIGKYLTENRYLAVWPTVDLVVPAHLF